MYGDGLKCGIRLKRNKFSLQAVQESNINPGRKLFYAEEEEVESRDVDQDVELFQSACDDIQRTISEIKQLKESNGKNNVCGFLI